MAAWLSFLVSSELLLVIYLLAILMAAKVRSMYFVDLLVNSFCSSIWYFVWNVVFSNTSCRTPRDWPALCLRITVLHCNKGCPLFKWSVYAWLQFNAVFVSILRNVTLFNLSLHRCNVSVYHCCVFSVDIKN